ncbi:hypothetical protein L9F63_028345, partial [Diploptera punctata]
PRLCRFRKISSDHVLCVAFTFILFFHDYVIDNSFRPFSFFRSLTFTPINHLTDGAFRNDYFRFFTFVY